MTSGPVPGDDAPVRALILNHSVRHGGPCWSLYYNLKYFDRSRIVSTVVVPHHDLFSRLVAGDQSAEVIADARYPESLAALRFEHRNLWTKSLSSILNSFNLFRLSVGLGRYIRQTRADVIYCNGTLGKLIGVIAGTLFRKPVVWHVRNIQLQPVIRAIYQWLSRRKCVYCIISVSEAAAQPYRLGNNHVVVVPNGIDLDAYTAGAPDPDIRRQWGCDERTVVFGSTGRVIPRKGFREFIEAGVAVMQRNPNVRLVIIGSTPDFFGYDLTEQLMAYARSQGVVDRVFCTGFQDDVPKYLRAIDVFVLPSQYPDPFPRVMLEAMAMKLPVIGTNIGGIPEAVVHEETGLLIQVGDIPGMSRAMERLAENPALCRSMGEAGLARIRSHFHVPHIARRVQAHLLEAVGRKVE